MEQHYASALLSLLRDGVAPEAAVSKVKDALLRRGRARLLPKIARAFRRLAEREASKDALVLTIARTEDREAALVEAEALLHGREADVRVDSTLVGGWRLEGDGRRVDRSHKKDLLLLYDRATSGL